ncbi:MAG TPA: GNAT family N-acetyltransferase [Trebonia sp.]|nr:GNAT family N-acetyltransferase [Trebonia sp.]
MRAVTPGDWAVMRDVRLTALREAPFAFGSSYAREAQFTEAQWRARITDRAVTYLAYASAGEPAGLAGVYVEDREAELVSMWVRPSARGQQVGSALIDAAAGWARPRGFGQLWLWVTESNEPARRLYERYGFACTGERQPLPSDPSLAEVRMRLPL